MTYVSDGRPIDQVVPRRGEYDFVFASHVIEHLTDPVGFLKSCEMLLKPDGKLLLVVPDKRRCFDVMQTRTTTGDLLDAHRRQATRHNPGAAFDYMANIADIGGHVIWEGHWAKKLNLRFNFSTTIEHAHETFDKVTNSPDYVDIHAWSFVPSRVRTHSWHR